MPALLLLALIVVPIVELYVIIQVGQGIGVGPTIVLLIVMSVAGGYLLRREGTRTWRSLRDAIQAGRVPAREVADGALVILGGALLLTPGFVTDLVGLLCILPPTRAVLRRLLTGVVARRLGVGPLAGGLAGGRPGRLRQPGQSGGPGRTGRYTHPGGPGHPGGSGRVVDGEVVDEGPPSPS